MHLVMAEMQEWGHKAFPEPNIRMGIMTFPLHSTESQIKGGEIYSKLLMEGACKAIR